MSQRVLTQYQINFLSTRFFQNRVFRNLRPGFSAIDLRRVAGVSGRPKRCFRCRLRVFRPSTGGCPTRDCLWSPTASPREIFVHKCAFFGLHVFLRKLLCRRVRRLYSFENPYVYAKALLRSFLHRWSANVAGWLYHSSLYYDLLEVRVPLLTSRFCFCFITVLFQSSVSQ